MGGNCVSTIAACLSDVFRVRGDSRLSLRTHEVSVLDFIRKRVDNSVVDDAGTMAMLVAEAVAEDDSRYFTR
jgi:hypothetical protein